MSEGHGLSRRSFVAGVLAFLGSVMGAVIALPAIGYLLSPVLKKTTGTDEWIPLGSVEDLEEGQPRLFTFTRTMRDGWEISGESFGVYVIKRSGEKFDVFSNICTHLSCRVAWDGDRESFVCPCHSGFFALDGSIISGPQPRPLDRFEYRIEEGLMQIHLVEV